MSVCICSCFVNNNHNEIFFYVRENKGEMQILDDENEPFFVVIGLRMKWKKKEGHAVITKIQRKYEKWRGQWTLLLSCEIIWHLHPSSRHLHIEIHTQKNK